MSAADLSKAVRARRHELGLTVAALCFGGGPSSMTINRIERGDPGARFRPTTLRAIDLALKWMPGSSWRCLHHDETPEIIFDFDTPKPIDPRDEKALRVGRLVLAPGPAEDAGMSPTLARPTEGPVRPMPDLIFAGPDCPDGCGELVYDYPGWRCETCEACWNDGGYKGEQPPIDLVAS